jgi:hypothetical protein
MLTGLYVNMISSVVSVSYQDKFDFLQIVLWFFYPHRYSYTGHSLQLGVRWEDRVRQTNENLEESLYCLFYDVISKFVMRYCGLPLSTCPGNT